MIELKQMTGPLVAIRFHTESKNQVATLLTSELNLINGTGEKRQKINLSTKRAECDRARIVLHSADVCFFSTVRY